MPILGSGRFGHGLISMSTPPPPAPRQPPPPASPLRDPPNTHIRGPGSFFFQRKCFYGEGFKGHPKMHFRASNSTRYSSYGCIKFHFQWKVHGRADQKNNTIFRNFWHFSNFDVSLKGEPRGMQKSKRTSQTAVVLEIWPPEVSISLEIMREVRTKTAIFSSLGFQTP